MSVLKVKAHVNKSAIIPWGHIFAAAVQAIMHSTVIGYA